MEFRSSGFELPSGSFDYPGNADQDYRSHKSDDYRPDHSATRPYPQRTKNPAAYNPAKNPQDDVDQDAVASTFHHLTSKPASNETYDDPNEDAHCFSLRLFLRCVADFEAAARFTAAVRGLYTKSLCKRTNLS